MQSSKSVQLHLDYLMRQPLLKEKELKKLKIQFNKSPTLSNTAVKKHTRICTHPTTSQAQAFTLTYLFLNKPVIFHLGNVTYFPPQF